MTRKCPFLGLKMVIFRLKRLNIWKNRDFLLKNKVIMWKIGQKWVKMAKIRQKLVKIVQNLQNWPKIAKNDQKVRF